MENRDEAFALARSVADFKQRYRSSTRKIMALVSELSMYQATALKLHAERAEAQAAVEAARARLAAGLAPTADAEREWNRTLRAGTMLEEMHRDAAAIAAVLEQRGANVATAAEQRPNAYIPEELGIPKPYPGTFLPFKPSDQGAGMRHIRKPQEREIVL